MLLGLVIQVYSNSQNLFVFPRFHLTQPQLVNITQEFGRRIHDVRKVEKKYFRAAQPNFRSGTLPIFKEYLVTYLLVGEVYILLVNESQDNPFEAQPYLTKVKKVLTAISKGIDVSAAKICKNFPETYFSLERVLFDEEGTDVMQFMHNGKLFDLNPYTYTTQKSQIETAIAVDKYWKNVNSNVEAELKRVDAWAQINMKTPETAFAVDEKLDELYDFGASFRAMESKPLVVEDPVEFLFGGLLPKPSKEEKTWEYNPVLQKVGGQDPTARPKSLSKSDSKSVTIQEVPTTKPAVRIAEPEKAPEPVKPVEPRVVETQAQVVETEPQQVETQPQVTETQPEPEPTQLQKSPSLAESQIIESQEVETSQQNETAASEPVPPAEEVTDQPAETPKTDNTEQTQETNHNEQHSEASQNDSSS